MKSQRWNGIDIPDFASLSANDWRVSVEAAFARADAALKVIVEDQSPPTFENTYIALERRKAALSDVTTQVQSLIMLSDDPELHKLGEEMSGRLEASSVSMFQNSTLGSRCIVAVAGKVWPEEEQRLIDLYTRRFRLAGAFLQKDQQIRLSEVCKALAEKMVQFGVIDQSNSSRSIHFKEGDLDGVSEETLAACASFAKDAGKDGFLVPLQPAYLGQILDSCKVREVRKALKLAYINRGTGQSVALHAAETPTEQARTGQGFADQDARPLITEILALRQEHADLLGCPNFASMVMEDRMSKTPDAAKDLIRQTWDGLFPAVTRDLQKLSDFAERRGHKGPLEAWDVDYYLEQFKMEAFGVDSSVLREYLPLDHVRACAFARAEELFGLKINSISGVPLPHPDAFAFEVSEAKTGAVRGVLWTDYFARPGKSPGAWMYGLNSGGTLDGQKPTMVINCLNATPPQPGSPALLSMDEAQTLFHELGHGLHALCDEASYPSLVAPEVVLDLVELPSQLFENWIKEEPYLSETLSHWETKAPPPPELVEKIINSIKFGQSLAQAAYLQSAWTDLLVHSSAAVAANPGAAFELEKSVSLELGAPSAIPPRHSLSHFSHLFGMEYAAGYYGYLWAETLEADVFDRCQKMTIVGENPGLSLRKTFFSKGNARAPGGLFEDFMGRPPHPDAFLRRLGIAEPSPAPSPRPRP
jgi:peptidyl-dipeptidase Dcp